MSLLRETCRRGIGIILFGSIIYPLQCMPSVSVAHGSRTLSLGLSARHLWHASAYVSCAIYNPSRDRLQSMNGRGCLTKAHLPCWGDRRPARGGSVRSSTHHQSVRHAARGATTGRYWPPGCHRVGDRASRVGLLPGQSVATVGCSPFDTVVTLDGPWSKTSAECL